MKKIGELIILSYKNFSVYPLDMAGTFLLYTLRVGVIILLYKSLYQTQGAASSIFAGYTFEDVVWPLLMTQVIAVSRPRGMGEEFTNDIRTGKLGTELILPIHYLVGKSIHHLTVMFSNIGYFTLLAGVIGWITIGHLPSLIGSIGLLVLMFFAAITGFCGYLFMGTIGFFVEDSKALAWIYSKLDLVFGGNILPVVFLPIWMQKIAYFTPFFHSGYSAALFLKTPTLGYFVSVLSMNLLWIGVFILSSHLLFLMARKHIQSNGG